MSCELRTFLNTDLPHLPRLWREHYSAVGIANVCSSQVWEYCVLNKPYFEPDSFWIACENGLPVGFLHATLGANRDGSDVGTAWGLVNAICIAPRVDEGEIAMALLSEAKKYFVARECREWYALSSTKHYAFYIGVAPGDGWLGVPLEDSRTREWLVRDQWEPVFPNQLWEVDLNTFRPPMDRNQIQIRRQCQVSRLLDGISPAWWLASSLGHAEEIRFQLQVRQAPFDAIDVSFWCPDVTIQGLDSQATYLMLPEFPKTGVAADRIAFLLAESLRQLHQERVTRVRTVSSMDSPEAMLVLQRLGFHSKGSGLSFRCKA